MTTGMKMLDDDHPVWCCLYALDMLDDTHFFFSEF